jgi:TatD DNase family protein
MTKEQTPKLALFDTHAHLDLREDGLQDESLFHAQFKGHFPSEISAQKDFGHQFAFQMVGIVNPGITLESSRQSIKFAQKYPFLYAAVGIHPNSTGKVSRDDWLEIVELSKNQHVTAIGETGLDRYWDTVPFETQLRYFEWHLELAKERQLPIMIHSRDCDDDMLAILGSMAKASPVFGVIHSFSSTPEVAERYLDMGLYISFSGAVTYTNKKFAFLHETAKMVPDDRLLIETDSPFLTPHPYRGKLDNNVPLMTAYTAKTLASLRGTTLETIAAITTANARKIFRKK